MFFGLMSAYDEENLAETVLVYVIIVRSVISYVLFR